MHKKFIALALAAVVLAGCDTLLESVGLGAAIGAGSAVAVGGDPAAGALLGGGVALLCEETNSCY